ncbi:uncharacterized protein BDW70DRAFT_62122 [Aspergillus foveolatus]|uniref:uncharacterized protein n=1 Tax=Aspergillus foveolatus TaxID=210207 RepID=UPI003CCD2026
MDFAGLTANQGCVGPAGVATFIVACWMSDAVPVVPSAVQLRLRGHDSQQNINSSPALACCRGLADPKGDLISDETMAMLDIDTAIVPSGVSCDS